MSTYPYGSKPQARSNGSFRLCLLLSDPEAHSASDNRLVSDASPANDRYQSNVFVRWLQFRQGSFIPFVCSLTSNAVGANGASGSKRELVGNAVKRVRNYLLDTSARVAGGERALNQQLYEKKRQRAGYSQRQQGR